MKTYDYIIRVSRMGDRIESAESTMTIDDQRERARATINAVGGRVGKEHLAVNVSGHTAADSKQYKAAVTRIRKGEAEGIALSYGDRFMRNWRKAGSFYETLE
jgi:hypothetical protein